MDKVARLVDTVNLMSYDYYEPGKVPSPAITPRCSPIRTIRRRSRRDASVHAFEQAGVPADKLVLGVPFYGHAWSDVPATANGLYQPGKRAPNVYANFSAIQSSMLGHGYTRFWDPWRGCPGSTTPKRARLSRMRIRNRWPENASTCMPNKLAGIMFWDFESDDPSGTLLKAVNACLR